MGIYKRNKNLARLIVLGGTILGSLGIWGAVSSHPMPAAPAPDYSAPAISSTNPNFSPTDSVLTAAGQPNVSTNQPSSQTQTQSRPSARLRTRGS